MRIMAKNSVYEYDKKGISLIVLVLTIITALIIITTVVMIASSEIDDANTNMFAKSLTEIQDATESYYIANNVMPLVDESTVMSKDELIAFSRVQDKLLEELTENNDLTSQFYKIDLTKIEITKVPYGNKKFGENDIFVVAYPSMNAYYPYGLDVNETTYFSITSKISNVTKVVSNNIDTSSTTVISSAGITVTKTNGWANKMGVNIEVEMASDELLYMSVSGDPNRLITTTTGQNTFGFNLLSSIVSDTETIKVPTLTLVEANYIELGTKPLTDRYVHILKYKNSEIIGKVKIDLSNFSSTLPTITSSILSSYLTINTAKLSLASSESGIREVRYEYLTKYLEDGTIANYNQGYADFDATYMQSKAKKIELNKDLTATISAPKDVQSIKIAIIDNAGNINLYNQEIAPKLYIGYTLNSATTSSLQLTANMYSINGIKSITFSKSVDGITFSDEQVNILNSTVNGVTTKQNTPFTDFTENTAYIKMVVVNYNSTITETRIAKVSLTGEKASEKSGPLLATGMTAKKWNIDTSLWETVTNPGTDTTWYNYDTENKQWANAQTEDGSMWVWIPRYEYKITTPHSSTSQSIAINFLDNIDTPATVGYTIHPAFTFGTTELSGIWVAKFEASGSTSAIDIKPSVASVRQLTISNIFTACRDMETNSRYGWGTTGTGIDTHLMKNIEWGAVVYLSQSIYGRNSEVWINPNSSYLTGHAGGSASAASTTSTWGYSTIGMNASTTANVTGVYDMSGGASEYTAAYINNGNAVLTTYGANLLNAASQYKDLYTPSGETQAGNYTAASGKKGDAVYETSTTASGFTGWFTDASYMPYTTTPFFLRGGYNINTTEAGLFNFAMANGMNYNNVGFRPVLLINPAF